MKKWNAIPRTLKFLLCNVALPFLFGSALFYLFSQALGSANPVVAAIYWLLVLVCILASLIFISPSMVKRIAKEIVLRLACRFFPRSRFAKPPLSYTKAR
jgi:hypothetical protein